ncbi:single-stranded DNA-binding protein [Hydrogenothermus marinus]|uniref:Single-stranded DNA-binding protein n=1 Tax=Hydrogenothermus marinus TaxID=133270 RepID=A0A3M0BK53_9AQUI|nr:single-stranded DNA-binding protein [Hydrogenothermus marinus]RMA97557.1 single-strand binding protein [Hydrogenothermus marinus]
MLNKVFLIGRLTRDPEIRFLPSGSQVTAFSIAVNRNYKVNDQWKEETSFFDIETFGALAERIGKQLSKGTQVLIEGQLKQDRWETSGGEKRSKIKIVATKINLLNVPAGEQTSSAPKKEEPMNLPEDIEDISSDEDVPF